jgi:hypothetical protein
VTVRPLYEDGTKLRTFAQQQPLYLQCGQSLLYQQSTINIIICSRNGTRYFTSRTTSTSKFITVTMSEEDKKPVADDAEGEEEEDEEDLEKLQAEIERMEAEAARITKETEELEKKKEAKIAASGGASSGDAKKDDDSAKRDG